VTQNIYDDPTFFAGYSGLPRSIDGLDGAPEWPALRAMLPDLKRRRVLDLGCGFGWFSRWAREAGADQVLAIDVSERMLAHARTLTDDTVITYLRADLETIELPPQPFDLAYSSLAFHYLVDLPGLLAKLFRALAPNGRLVFSVEHPLMTAPTPPAWASIADGRKIWPVEGYLNEGERSSDWLAKGVIKRHRTLATTVNLLIEAGFTLAHLDEWGPSEAQVAARPDWAIERERPMFLLVAANHLD
jgi:SAM-dependent methyltransferase